MQALPAVIEARALARRFDNLARLEELRGKAGEEYRAPTAATLPVSSYQSPGQPMIPAWDAASAMRMAYLANVIVYRCMQILANTVAACPFRAGAEIPEQPGQVRPHDPQARLAQLLGPPPGGPAPKLSARRLWAWTVVQRKVTGRYGWEVETTQPRGKGEIAALWPLVSANLEATPSESGTDWFKGFRYGPWGNRDKQRSLTPEQIVYGWDPSAEDFRQPESCLQSARLDISIAVMSDRYAYGFLRNDARPATVVVTEAFESDQAYRAFKSNWQGEFGGPENAGKALFAELPEDASYKPSEAIFVQTLGLSQKQAQFMEQHQASLERVAMACGVPWSRLSAAARTFDNASQEDSNFWFDTMLPLLADLADEVNMQLAPRVGREVGWFDLSHVEVFQPKRRFSSMTEAGIALDHEVATVNEVREDIALDDVEGGDVFFRPATLPQPGDEHDQVIVPDAIMEPLELPSAASSTVETRTVQHSHFHTHADGTIHRHLHRHPDGVEDHGDWANVTHAHSHPETMGAPHDADRLDAGGDHRAGGGGPVGLAPLTLLDPSTWTLEDSGVSPRLLGVLARQVEAGELTAVQAIALLCDPPGPVPPSVTVNMAAAAPVEPPHVQVDVAPVEITLPPMQVDVTTPDVHVEVPRSKRVIERDDQGRMVSVVEEPC